MSVLPVKTGYNPEARKQPMAPQNKLIKRHRLGYPPASLAVISATRYIVGGGGGKSKTGVPNRVRTCQSKMQSSGSTLMLPEREICGGVSHCPKHCRIPLPWRRGESGCIIGSLLLPRMSRIFSAASSCTLSRTQLSCPAVAVSSQNSLSAQISP
jgi:hypothetical protein